MHLGPDDVLLALDAEFKAGVSAAEVSRAVNRIEAAVRQRFPEIGRISIESRRVTAPEAGPGAALVAATPSAGRRSTPSRRAR